MFHKIITVITFACALNFTFHDSICAMDEKKFHENSLLLCPSEILHQILHEVSESTLIQLSSQSRFFNSYYKNHHGVTLTIDGPKVYDFLAIVHKENPYIKINLLILRGCWKDIGSKEIYHCLFGCITKTSSLKLDNVFQLRNDWIIMATLMPRSVKTLGFDRKSSSANVKEDDQMHAAMGIDRWGQIDQNKCCFRDFLPVGLEKLSLDNFGDRDLLIAKSIKNLSCLKISSPLIKSFYSNDFLMNLKSFLSENHSLKSLTIENFNFKSLSYSIEKLVDDLPNQLKVLKIIGHDIPCCGKNDEIIDVIRKLPAGLEVFEMSRHLDKICLMDHRSKDLDLIHLPYLKTINFNGCCMNPTLKIISNTPVYYSVLPYTDKRFQNFLSGVVVHEDYLSALPIEILIDLVTRIVSGELPKVAPENFFKIAPILTNHKCGDLKTSRVTSLNLSLQLLELADQQGSFCKDRLGKLCYEIAIHKDFFSLPSDGYDNNIYSTQNNSSFNNGRGRERYFLKGVQYGNQICSIKLALYYMNPDLYDHGLFENMKTQPRLQDAFKLLTPLANSANPLAQYYLGDIYTSMGDRSSAQVWFKRAAMQGHELARNALNEMKK